MSARLEELRKTKPRSTLLRASIVLLALLVVWAWTSGDFDWSDLWSDQRGANVRRFFTEELTPFPLR